MKGGNGAVPAVVKPTQAVLMHQGELSSEIFRPGAGVTPAYSQVVQQPWVSMPPDGEPFNSIGAIEAPAPSAGVLSVVVSLRVGYGWEGIIKRFGHFYLGDAFIPGTGAILWSIRMNGARFLRGLANLDVPIGSLESGGWPVEGGFRIFSNDLVEYLVTIPAASPVATGNGNRVFAWLQGYLYPVKTSGRL